MPIPDQWQALDDALTAYDEAEDSPDLEKRRPENIAIRAVHVVLQARELLETHDQEVLEEHEQRKRSLEPGPLLPLSEPQLRVTFTISADAWDRLPFALGVAVGALRQPNVSKFDELAIGQLVQLFQAIKRAEVEP